MTEIRRVLGKDSLRAEGFELSWVGKGKLEVTFESGRRHLIRYRLKDEHYLLRATIATSAQLEGLARANRLRYGGLRKRLCREILLQNQHTESVCFRLNDNDKLEAVISQRAATLHRDELVYYASQLAREADRFEALLSDRDRW